MFEVDVKKTMMEEEEEQQEEQDQVGFGFLIQGIFRAYSVQNFLIELNNKQKDKQKTILQTLFIVSCSHI